MQGDEQAIFLLGEDTENNRERKEEVQCVYNTARLLRPLSTLACLDQSRILRVCGVNTLRQGDANTQGYLLFHGQRDLVIGNVLAGNPRCEKVVSSIRRLRRLSPEKSIA
jgi:hypothetical protein